MTVIALIISHVVVAAAAYVIGINRNRAAAKAEIEAAKAEILAKVEAAKAKG